MIETMGLTKRYGDRLALDEVSLSVPDGSVYGLVGPNGAGKTTLLNLLAGLRQSTSGELRLEVPRSRIAVLPDTPRFDSWLTGREVVELALTLVDPGRSGNRDGQVDTVLERTGLFDAAGRAVAGYSRGMLQRLGIASTIVGEPELVLLDEPASALDPHGRREVLDLIAALRGKATVLFSSHILADVQEVCDTVGVLAGGKLIFQGPIESLLVGEAVPRYRVRVRPPLEPVASSLREQDWVLLVTTEEPDVLVVQVGSLDDAETRLVPALAQAGARVVSMGPEAVSLERAYLELTR